MAVAGHRLGVAVSGGADSVAMLLMLRELAASMGVVLSVVHLNHRLRGADSDADERFVRELAARHGLDFRAQRADVAAEARRQGWNLEDAGRRLRRRFFERLVEEKFVDRVAVAHTADDQAETVLAHLLRGTGISGLAGIHPVAGYVVRPLLEVRRAELRAFLTQRGQAWREDASNEDRTRLRARIRHALIPQLERDYQPALVERLAQLADIAKAEEEFWEAVVEDEISRVAVCEGEAVSVEVAALAGAARFGSSAPRRKAAGLSDFWPDGLHRAIGLRKPEKAGAGANNVKGRIAGRDGSAGLKAGATSLARRLVRRVAKEIGGEGCRPTAEHVARVLELAQHGRGGQRIELPGGVVVERSLDARLRFWKPGQETKTSAASYHYDVQWPLGSNAAVEVREVGSRFRLKLIDWPATASDTSVAQVLLDASLLAPPLVLRSWQVGDAYRPAGRRRVYKLKELLYRARIDARQRASWPVLASAGRVVWARGFPPAAECVPTGRTRAGLVIAEERI
ncbi:MAG: tRNA lysidine(34) synthetase TilS [Candidatus Acidiferrales bacterium]